MTTPTTTEAPAGQARSAGARARRAAGRVGLAPLVGAGLAVVALALWWLAGGAERAVDTVARDESAAGSVSDAPILPPPLDSPPAVPMLEDGSSADAVSRAVRDGRLHITILHADGIAAAFAPVALVGPGPAGTGPVLLERGLTDASGYVAVRIPINEPIAEMLANAALATSVDADAAGHDAALTLWIGGVSSVPTGVPVEQRAGEWTIRLAKGLPIAGRVLLDGLPPSFRLPIALEASVVDAPTSRLPAEVEAFLTLDVPGVARSSLPNARYAAPDGGFRFTVPDGFSGRLVLPWPYRFETSGTCRVLVVAPETQLLPNAHPVPAVRGRAFQPDGIWPAGGAALSWRLDGAHGERTGTLLSDEAGRFEIPLEIAGHFELRLRHEASRSMRVLARGADEIRFGLELGDLALWGERVLDVFVRDETGRPVENAWVSTERGPQLGVLTDAGGKASLVLPVDESHVQARAVGLNPERIALPPLPADGRVPIVLEKGATLAVGGYWGRAWMSGLTMRLSAPEPPFASVAGGAEVLPPRTGLREHLWSAMSASMTRAVDGVVTHRVEVPAHALEGKSSNLPVVEFSPLRPGLPLRVEILDENGQLIAFLPEQRLEPGESRRTFLDRVALKGTARVTVVDDRSRPVARASLRAFGPGATSALGASTDNDGTARLKSLGAGSLTLAVEAAGFGTRLVDLRVPVEGEADVRVSLDPARQVEVLVRTSGGQPVVADHIWAQQRGWTLSIAVPSRAGDGSAWTLGSLPQGEVEIHVSVDARNLRTAHDTAAGLCEFVVPPWRPDEN